MTDFNIITFHTALNHGAVLQTLGLQEFIRQQGFGAAVYDYQPSRSVKPHGVMAMIESVLRKFHEEAYCVKEENFANFLSDNITLTNEKSCKVFLSGSDQVWNPVGSMNPMFFLQFLANDCLHASYAASMGVTKVPAQKKALFESYIKSFDAVSVREQDVKDVISEFYAGEIDVNVDPTLLHTADFWRKYERSVNGLPEKFTLVYVLHLGKNVNQLLKWLKRETQEEIVLIDGRGMLTYFVKHDRVIHHAGPGQFLWLVDHAQRVVTTSFHGTAFSIIFEKEFYSIVNPAAPSRINHILSLVGLEPVKETDTSFVRRTGQDWEKVRVVLAEERKKSADYIQRVYVAAVHLKREPLRGTAVLMHDSCTGCSACHAVCAKNAITMKLNEEGFFEPVIDESRCVDCNRCLQVCPQNKRLGNDRVAAWYGWHNDKDVRFNSSSGGVMRALADTVLAEGGVVYGAVFDGDCRSVVFSNSDESTMEQLQKSKYTVSDVTGKYREIREQLNSGRKVMFCGTPCQCAGLTAYLGKSYPNLLRCDFVCGGMSSLKFYQEHLDYLEKKFGSKIAAVDFRPKDKGWGKQRIKVTFENGKVYCVRSHLDSYFKSFANLHISVRNTCLKCLYTGAHASDITFADFWGLSAANIRINKEGLSLFTANTAVGKSAVENTANLESFPLEIKYSDYAFLMRGPNLIKMEERNCFFDNVKGSGSFEKAFQDNYPTDEWSHILSYVKLKLHIK